MFAKLKKKVIEENGGRGMEVGDKSLTASPAAVLSRRESGTPAAIHSPLSKEPPVGGLKAAYSMERLAASPPVPAPEESGGRESAMSREDLLALLAKRTEQCKKMEGNISDLAALIKDKNKTLEQLETQNQQHEEVLNKRLAEQKAEFEAYRDKLIAGYQEDKLAMDKEKQEVTQKLLLAEEYRDKFLKREADTDEIQDFTVQELAKVKHMLLLAQTELESQRKELESKSQLLTTCQSREKQLEVDLTQTTGRLDVLEKECERLRDDNKERAELVTSLSKEKSVFEQRLNQLNTELTEKQNKIVEINRQLSDVDSSYRALEHSSEMHRNKAAQQTAKLLEEKQEHIDMHQERVATLEQRLHDQSLSGDDRVTALQAEREGLEKKLSETRQQLTEIKSTWSDKISHLEAQISHLNTKIVEDSEELASSQRAADSMRENFHKQMEDLRAQLEDAEKRALENYEMASSAQSKHEQQVRDLEGEVSRSRLSAVDMETQLRGKVTSLELQLSELTTAREAQADEFRMQMEQKERQTQEAIERELKQEHLLKTTEARCSQLQNEVTSQQEELGRLKRQLDVQNHASSGQDLKVQKLEQQVEELKTELTATRSDLSATRRQFNESDQEKGELMVRNAQLSQQLTSHQQQLSQQRGDLESQLAEREQTIQGQEEIIANLNERMAALQSQIQELESLNAALGSTDHLESTIQSLQDQLADKTRTLKKQEQTVKDLRQTLQRELRVQALPNDEASDDNNAPSPSVPRKHLPPPRQAVPPTSASPQSASLTMTSSAVLPVSSSSSVSSSTTAAVKPMTLTSMMQVSQERGIVVRRDLEQDINFQYLKHVVLKFMLSRESEAVQLIKAVAVLLNFSHQEQQLIRQTLEWKMSWFGSKPSMGKGQKSKIVPPPF